MATHSKFRTIVYRNSTMNFIINRKHCVKFTSLALMNLIVCWQNITTTLFPSNTMLLSLAIKFCPKHYLHALSPPSVGQYALVLRLEKQHLFPPHAETIHLQ